MSILTILGMFWNIPSMLLGGGVLAWVIGTAVVAGPVGLLTLLRNWRVWVVIAIALGGIAFWQAGQTIEKQKEEIATQAVVIDAKTDNAVVVTGLIRRKTVRAAATVRQQAVIAKAPPGEKLDTLLDEIAREQSAARSTRN